jgi:hypothetical protein
MDAGADNMAGNSSLNAHGVLAAASPRAPFQLAFPAEHRRKVLDALAAQAQELEMGYE